MGSVQRRQAATVEGRVRASPGGLHTPGEEVLTTGE